MKGLKPGNTYGSERPEEFWKLADLKISGNSCDSVRVKYLWKIHVVLSTKHFPQYIFQYTLCSFSTTSTWRVGAASLSLLDLGRLCILWPRSCQFDAKCINRKLLKIFSRNFAHMFTSLSAHIWIKKIIILKVPPELNVRWDSHINFSLFRGILMHCTG